MIHGKAMTKSMTTNSAKIEMAEIKAFCDQCEESGELLPTGLVICTDPPKYEHKCVVCGHKEVLESLYPRIVYKEIGGNN